MMEVRLVGPDEYARLGALTLEAYTSLPGHVHEPDYEDELYDVRSRAEAPATEVWVAAEPEDERLLGGVTYVVDHTSPYAESVPDGTSAIRMLAVDRAAQGRGIGTALVRHCVARAVTDGRSAVMLHTTPWMTTAHRLYERIGFVRDPSHDWQVTPDYLLLGYRLDLDLT